MWLKTCRRPCASQISVKQYEFSRFVLDNDQAINHPLPGQRVILEVFCLRRLPKGAFKSSREQPKSR
jgi:hypothetical protein